MNKLIDQIRTQFIQRGKNLTDQEEEKLKIDANNKNIDKEKNTNKNKKCCCVKLLNMLFN